MKRFFTSDWHLNSALIGKYAHRPVIDAKLAAQGLIDMCNKLAGPEDTVIHVGDFILEGYDRHGKEEDCAKDMPKQDAWMKQIKAKFFCIEGNHDTGHNGESAAKCLLLDLNQNYRGVTCGHHPSYCKEYAGNYGSTSKHGKIHIHLCGHVHGKWKYSYDNKNYVLNYNVGVDCHNYRLVKDSDITEDLDFIFTYHDFNNSWKMTCEDEVKWKAEIKLNLNIARTQRKHDRYLKKGLTEAECLRRKEEALRKKGLLKSK